MTMANSVMSNHLKGMLTVKSGINAPIALFVYNRPWHIQQTVEALQKNVLAAESDLFIFSDASKTPETSSAVEEVRNYIKTIHGFKSVNIIEREKNFGLAASIISGVTQVCAEYGKIIVLEDDLVTSLYFLKFMNDALNFYQHEERVISIHGYMYPVVEKLPSTFFLRGADCWGWATWKRGWDLFDVDSERLLKQVRHLGLKKEFNYDNAYNLTAMLVSEIRKKVDSWAIRWYASAFLQNKLTLYPGKSLILNIGNDGSGTHCEVTDTYSGEVEKRPVDIDIVPIEENIRARSCVINYLKTNKAPLSRRLTSKAAKCWKRLWS